MDLRDQHSSFAGPTGTPITNAEADADQSQDRHALRRRRLKLAIGGSGFAAAALCAVFVLTSDFGAGDSKPAATHSSTVATTQLVAYTGRQPKGFTLDKVPDGWFVQTDDEVTVVLAPGRVRIRPSADPSVDPLNDSQSYVGKIGVMLQSGSVGGPSPGTAVTIGDRRGVLVKDLGNDGDGSTLWIEQPGGTYILIQFWEDFGLSQAQMVDFGAGVHVVKRVAPSAVPRKAKKP